jgi:hypothetical protein
MSMVDKNVSEAAEAGDMAYGYAAKGMDAAREYAGTAQDYANKGYDAAREYANASVDVAARIGDNLTEFVRKEPLIAIAAAFAVGYLAARIMRRLSI